MGVEPGARVAVLLANGHRYLEAYFAVPGMGAILVPLNNRLAVPELRYILQDAGVHTLVVDDLNLEVGRALSDCVTQVVAGDLHYEQLLQAAEPESLPTAVDEDALAGLFYTGGTTGAAKGVMLTHRNLLANALHIALALQYSQEDIYLHAAPMFHLADGASTFAVTWVGGCHAFLPAFDPRSAIALIEREKVTAVLMVPAMISAVVTDPLAHTANFGSLRFVVHGAAPISTTLLTTAIAVMKCDFYQGYGMTEAAPLVTILEHEEQLLGDARLRSAGREVAGVEVQVRREDGSLAPPGEVGEVVLRGANVMRGYWNKPAASAEVLIDGWYWSRDLGYLDGEGYLFLVDRAKDMIISGGENVYSIEVEEAIAQHPAVMDVAVFGVPDDRWGERVHAVVALRAGHSLALDALRDHCRSLIADFKCPRSLDFIGELPRSGAGKVLKRELREPYWADADRRVH